MRLLLDSMIYDKLLVDSGIVAKLKDAIEAQIVELVRVPVVEAQLEATPDPERRTQLLRVYRSLPATDVPSSGFMLDVRGAGLDQAEWATKQVEQDVSAVVGAKNLKENHYQDAMIAASAQANVDVLVTCDKRLAKSIRRARLKLTVWGYQRLTAVASSRACQ